MKSSGGAVRKRGATSPGPRARAVEILVRVHEEDAWASRLLESIDEGVLDPRDLALLHEIVLGVLRWRGALDGVLRGRLRKPLAGMDPAVREALRVGAYQILYLDRVPAHAAVDESVTIARRASGPGAGGLVNAVLRKIAAERAPLAAHIAKIRSSTAGTGAAVAGPGGAAPSGAASSRVAPVGAQAPAPKGVLRRLAADYSHPEWMVARLLERFGETEARAWMFANNEPPPLTLRPNPCHSAFAELGLRLAAEGVTTRPAALAPGALRVLEGRPVRTALFASGAYWIQDEASQIVPLLFPPPWEGVSADLCAAPGGKTFVLATGPVVAPASAASTVRATRSSRAPAGASPGRVVAFDLHERRLARLLEGALRVAPDRIGAAAADLTAGAPAPDAFFDRVLVDAPCSGTGVLRRHPEIRWRLTPDRLAVLAELQSRLLDTGYALLRPGGHLVYSVCSVEPEECDAVVDAFVARSGARAVDPRAHLDAGAPFAGAIDAKGRLRTLPHRHGSDGFFAALFCRPPASGATE
jgi:16S rRNA (cytosine967-C5)-methyltransferase